MKLVRKVKWTAEDLSNMCNDCVLISGEDESDIFSGSNTEDTHAVLEEITGMKILSFDINESNGEKFIVAIVLD